MTAETSNARGEWVLVPREPTPEMVQASDEISCRAEGAEHWAAMLAAAPQPATADPKTLPVPTRVHLIGETAVIVGTPQRGWDEDAQDAHNCDDMGCATIGPHVLARVPFTDERDLSQQPEARGVVDEAMVERATTAYLQSRGTYEGEVPVDRDDMRAALTAALAQQPAAVDGAYPAPRNRAEAVALARLALAYLGVIDAHIDTAIARCETDLATQHQDPTT